jgi:hypothetical protein
MLKHTNFFVCLIFYLVLMGQSSFARHPNYAQIDQSITTSENNKSEQPTKKDDASISGSFLSDTDHLLLTYEKEINVMSIVIIACFTVILGVSTIFLWSATRRAANATQTLADLTGREFIATYRPRLRVRNVRLQHSVPPNLQPLDLIATGQRVRGQIDIVNTGETEARIIESHCDVHWSNNFILPVNQPHETTHPNNFAKLPVLVSGGAIAPEFLSTDLMGNDAKSYNAATGGHRVHVYGWIRYTDSRKVKRLTAFCRRYEVPEGKSFPRFSKVDDPDYEYED